MGPGDKLLLKMVNIYNHTLIKKNAISDHLNTIINVIPWTHEYDKHGLKSITHNRNFISLPAI